MGKPLRVLVVEDSEDDTLLTINALKQGGFNSLYERAEDAETMRKALRNKPWDVILCDYQMPKFNGLAAIALLKESGIDIPLIIVSGAIGEETAVECMRMGARDYIMKSNLPRLASAVDREMNETESRRERKRAVDKLKESKTLIEAVVENVPLMIFLKEAIDLRFVIFNRAGEELLGYDRKDLLGKNNLDLFPPEQAAHFMAKDREVLDGKAGMLDIPEELIQTARKGQRLLHTRKVCIRGSDGATKYLLGISEDITERKEAEKQLQDTLISLKKAVGVTIQAMVSAVETRDPYTAGHQVRSADLACTIATEMGLSQDRIDGIHLAGSIHDIGKLSIPAEILSKPTELSQIEYALIKEHACQGYKILKNVVSSWPLAEMIYQHHERINGSGYPRRLKGDDILMEARILAVADVVEAMASHRPYRPALGINVALEEIEKNIGTLYDEAVADSCLKLFREKGFQLERT
jgi:PAS domain S-box-containing protein